MRARNIALFTGLGLALVLFAVVGASTQPSNFEPSHLSTGGSPLELVGIGYHPPPGAVSRAGIKMQGVIDGWSAQPFDPTVQLAGAIGSEELSRQMLGRYGKWAHHGSWTHDGQVRSAMASILDLDPGWFARTGRGDVRAGEPSNQEVLDAGMCDGDMVSYALALRTVGDDATPERPGRWKRSWDTEDWTDYVRRGTGRRWFAIDPDYADLILTQVRERVADEEWIRPAHPLTVRTLYGDERGELSAEACSSFLVARSSGREWGIEGVCG